MTSLIVKIIIQTTHEFYGARAGQLSLPLIHWIILIILVNHGTHRLRVLIRGSNLKLKYVLKKYCVYIITWLLELILWETFYNIFNY